MGRSYRKKKDTTMKGSLMMSNNVELTPRLLKQPQHSLSIKLTIKL